LQLSDWRIGYLYKLWQTLRPLNPLPHHAKLDAMVSMSVIEMFTAIEQDFVGFFGRFSRSSRKSGSCAAKAACFKRADPWRGGPKR
jgi:hypothetical protein